MTPPHQQPVRSSLGQVLAIVQAVVAIVPRWLVVAAGVIFLTWSAFEIYIGIQGQLLDLSTKRAQNCQARVEAMAGSGVLTRDALGQRQRTTAAQRQWDADCGDYLPDQYNKQQADALPALAALVGWFANGFFSGLARKVKVHD